MPVEVGVGYVSIVPETRGFGRLLEQQISGPAADAGQTAGQESGTGFLSGMSGRMKAGIAAVGVAAGAAFAAGFVTAVEQDRATKRLGAQLGLSAQESARAGRLAGDVYAKGYGESIDQVADSLRQLSQHGVTALSAPRKEVEGLSKSALTLAETFEVEVGDAARAAGQLMKTGMVANAREAFDLITAGFQGGADKSGDFLDTLNEYSTQWRDLGLTGSQAVGLITQGLGAGARDADIVADALKEFAIRAKDGSDTTIAGFKALGLNADDMAAKFSKGGSGAAAALDTVFDRLRGIEDPVKRSQTAVQLFGTQAEDLQQSLFALDLSSATKALGDVGGAAQKMGKTLHSGAGHDIEVFKRQMLQGLGEIVGRVALPALREFGNFLTNYVGPALRGLTDAFAAGVRWVRDYGAWFAPLGVAVAGLTITMNASAIATGAVTAVFAVYRGVILGAAAVTRGYAIVQGFLNAVMSANPIGLLITGLLTLGTALFVAYQKSETFRRIVQGAWAGIQKAASWAWNNVLKPVVDGLVAGWQWVSAGAVSLWQKVQPVFGYIATGAKILATVIGVILVGPAILAFKVLGAVASWLWTNAIGPAFRGIGAGAMWLWNNAISPVIGWIVAGFRLWWAGVKIYFAAVRGAFRAVGDAAVWLWNNAIKPVWNWIVAGAKVTWSGVKAIFGYFMSGLRTVGGWFKWLYTNAVKPAWEWIKSSISTVWNSGIKPVFDKLKLGVKAIGASFRSAREFIGEQWSKLSGIAKKPVAFVVNTVYSKGIVPVWNAVAKAFGAPKLKAMAFKTGGVLPGYTPGRDVHRFYSPTGGRVDLSGGEAIMRPEFTRGVGADFVNSMNRIAKSRGAGGVRAALAPLLAGNPETPVQKYADGGVFGWIGQKVAGAGSATWEAVKKASGWLADGIEASARAGVDAVVRPLLKLFPGAGAFGEMLRRVPREMIDALFGYSKEADKRGGGSAVSGPGIAAALRWARTQHGKRYQWGGNGNPSWDCSGFLSAIESVIRGQKPHRRWSTFAFQGQTAPQGWRLGARSGFEIGITNKGVGHTAGTLGGVNVESRGGDGVVVGPRARGARDPMFTHRYGFGKGYASGGRPRPGEIAWVGERGPELVRFRGGETVYDHRTSLGMAEGLYARGFAKGTSVASARRQIPGDLAAFTKSLTGSSSAIAKAAKELAGDLKAAGGAGKKLAASTGQASKTLQDMARQRDSVDSRYAAARQAATDQAGTARDYLGLGNIADPTSIGGLISGMQSRQAALKAFQGQIKTAQKKGVSQSLIAELVAAGPDSGLARLVSSASAAQIKQMNALAKSGAKLSTSYGRTMADAMYDAGAQAGRGFLTGLQAQEKELQAAMNRLGAGLVSSIRKELKIKSPSRVTRAVGEQIGAGLIGGVDDSLQPAAAAAARLAAAATPVPAAAGRAAAGDGVLRRGDTLVLRVGEREFVAVVDERVDAGLDAARRRTRAGVRT